MSAHDTFDHLSELNVSGNRVWVVRAVKAVQQTYNPDGRALRLLDEFRLMMNQCVRIGVEENVSSLKALSLKSYPQLSEYDAISYYKLCAISTATGI